MMTLNETMEREYKIPMRLVGTPRNAVITGDLPDTVRITVRDKDSPDNLCFPSA